MRESGQRRVPDPPARITGAMTAGEGLDMGGGFSVVDPRAQDQQFRAFVQFDSGADTPDNTGTHGARGKSGTQAPCPLFCGMIVDNMGNCEAV